ncbi:hybrid sensor histidine kinase/response regulator [Geomonas limicola]|uniref:histidine kinase n=1 Tax=Geomonas limicola TaxID=2740186 RepID=A0A6V8NE05_9BACT|nr:response regulator [Geomonas limicola]GFO69803.1 hybrid sensor histidine kinase/response regulator [Geomonas limicola]
MADQEALLRELLETFRLEAQDHLDSVSTLLISLEREPEKPEQKRLVESLFRRMHTLKGAAHAVNLGEVALICQDLESLLSEVKRGELPLEVTIYDRLHREVDLLAARIFQHPGSPGPASFSAPGAAPTTTPEPLGVPSHPVFRGGPEPSRPEQAVTLPPSPVEAPRAQDRRDPSGTETVRVPTRLLESLLLQAEELVSTKLAAAMLQEELSLTARLLTERTATRSRAQELAGYALRSQGPAPASQRLAGLIQEFCDSERECEVRLRGLERLAERNQHNLAALIDPLLAEMKQLQLLPFATLSDPFQKLVRDLGRELGKEAELSCRGAEIEVDRRILAELKEPLLHLVRNVMDHGIEAPLRREEAGKPRRGSVEIELRLLDANHARLTVRDDGRGIDASHVKATALRLELISPEPAEQLSDHEALQLVFESGFSTSPLITSLSGRGVGLAIVRESLERLGGHVTVSARPGLGCEFAMTLPLSFALIRALLVSVGKRSALIPAGNVELTSRLPREEVRQVENRDTVLLGGEVCSLVSLAAVLELGEKTGAQEEPYQQVVLVKAAERRIAFAVDQVLGVQEVLVKPLGGQLSRVRNVSGATVLGDGRVVPILNVNDLVRSALLVAGSAARPSTAQAKGRRLSVMVAEDSITSRTLLKNILEAAGYQVATAYDGADALTQLKAGSFDLVVSDVEMPRLDGFQLTAALRSEPRFAELPVILVTGLESRSDRERGIEVGANAYVVKSSFDQSSLIEVIERLT